MQEARRGRACTGYDLSLQQKTASSPEHLHTLSQAVLDERLVLVLGTNLETYYRQQLLPPFVAAYGQIAAACVQLSGRVGGQPGCQVMHA